MAVGDVFTARGSIALNDRELLAGLARAEAQVRATVKRLDGLKFTVDGDVDLDDGAARAKIRALERERITIPADVRLNEKTLRDLERKLAEATRARTIEVETNLRGAGRSEATLDAMARKRSVTFDADVKDLGRVEAALDAVARDRVVKFRTVTTGTGTREGVDSTTVRNMQRVGRDSGRMRGFGSAIANATLNLGPFNVSLKALLAIMVALGPAITAVGAAIIGLGAAVSAGIIGALVGAGAAMGGFALAAGGIAAIMIPLVKNFENSRGAAEKYEDAIRNAGKGSQAAKDALAAARKEMGGVPESTVRAISAIDNLWARFRKMTVAGGVRPMFFNALAEGVRTLESMLPMLAQRSVESFSIVTSQLTKFAQGMRTQGAPIIDTLWRNFNAALPNIMSGLGQLALALGRVFASASRWLAPVAQRFSDWATRMANAAGATGKLDAAMDRIGTATKNTWNILTGFGRVLKALFTAALGPGSKFAGDFATALHKLATSMQSVAGQAKLRDFFVDFISTFKQLWEAMKPLGQMFISFSTITRPVLHALTATLEPIADLISALMKLSGFRFIMQGVFAFLLVGFAASRIVWWIAKLALLRAALMALVGGGIGAKLATLLGGGAAGAAGGGALAKLLQTLKGGGGATGAATLGAALAGAGRMALRFLGPIGLVTTAVMTLANVIKTPGERIAGLNRHFNEASSAATRARGELVQNRNQLLSTTQASQQHNQSLAEAKRALDATKPGTAAYRQALQNFNREYETARQVGAAQIRVRQQNTIQSTKEVAATRSRTEAARQEVAQAEKQLELARNVANVPVIGPTRLAKAEASLAAARERATRANLNYNQALNRQAAVVINAERARRGMVALVGREEQAVGRLARVYRSPELARKVAVQFPDPREAGRVAQAAGQALQAGASRKIVYDVIANTRNAETALARLNAITVKEKLLQVKANVAPALRAAESITGLRFADKILRILANPQAAIRSITTVNARRMATKISQIIANPVRALLGIAAVNRARTPAKRVSVFGIITDAIAKIGSVNRTQVPGKKATVVGVITDAIAKIGQVVAKVVPPKKATVTGNVANALSGINAVVARLASVRDKTVTLTTIVRTMNISGSVNAGAEGGVFVGGIKAFQTGGVNRRERPPLLGGPGRRTIGEVVSAPKFLVGEERRPEVVIATNPAYRDRNLRLWQLAGRMLGVPGFPASGMAALSKIASRTTGGVPAFRDGGITSVFGARGGGMPGPARPAMGIRRTRHTGVMFGPVSDIKHPGQLPILQQFRNLIDLQKRTDLEYTRVSGQIYEPESFVTEKGTNEDGEPEYEVNQAAVEAYMAQVEAARQVLVRITQISQQIMQMIPRVLAAINEQIEFHKQQKTLFLRQANTAREAAKQSDPAAASAQRSKATTLTQQAAAEQKLITQYGETKGTITSERDNQYEKQKEYIEAGNELTLKARAVQEKIQNPAEGMGGATGGGEGGGGAAGGEGGGGAGGTGEKRDPAARMKARQMYGQERYNLLAQYGANWKPFTFGAGQNVFTPFSVFGGGVRSRRRQRALGIAPSMAMMGGGGVPGMAMGGVVGGGRGGGGRGDTNYNITNHFAAAPPDPHTWTKQQQWEIRTAAL